MNAEEIYSLWHKEIFKAKGKHVRPIKNFDKARNSGKWKYFEGFSSFLERNNGYIDPDIYMRALAEHFKDFFPPAVLGSQKSIKIYKDYQKQMEEDSNFDSIRKEIIDSIKFIVKFSRKNKLKTLSEYISHDMYLIPSILKHYDAKSISMYFIACIDNFPIMMTNYAADVVADYGKEVKEKYDLYRIRVMSSDDTKILAQKVSIVIEKYLQK